MLNGKFFTGLPPKMIDRGAVGRNRMESHFFWPDDSKAESAADMKVKRRNSMQVCDRPIYEKQISVEPNDVDTKKRFSKEFSQSSIQFYDNLNDNKSTTRRLNSGGLKKTELAEKPTATKLELPESVVDEAYTTAKRKQAYMSKIQFYDFVNDEENNRKHLRTPKRDMNDKREMELNSKNSPKLQMKRDVRSLSEEKETPKVNNREVRTLQRTRYTKEDNVNRAPVRDFGQEGYNRRSEEHSFYTNPQSSALNKRNIYHSDRGSYRSQSERNNYREPSSITPEKSNINPNRPSTITEPMISNKRDVYRRSNSSALTNEDQYYRNSHNFKEPEVNEVFYEDPLYRCVRNDTKRPLDQRSQYEFQNNRKYVEGYEDEIDREMKSVRIQQSPPRKYSYHREEFYEPNEDPRYSRHRTISTDQTTMGNSRRNSDNYGSEKFETDLPYMANMGSIDNSGAPISRVTNRLNNEMSSLRNAPPISEMSSQVSGATSPMEANTSQKHLRSSLCFHDGAIIAENDATRSPTSQQPMPRRNARSSAATKRVSVGLPD